MALPSPLRFVATALTICALAQSTAAACPPRPVEIVDGRAPSYRPVS
jgi:hypothetical protein